MATLRDLIADINQRDREKDLIIYALADATPEQRRSRYRWSADADAIAQPEPDDVGLDLPNGMTYVLEVLRSCTAPRTTLTCSREPVAKTHRSTLVDVQRDQDSKRHATTNAATARASQGNPRSDT